MTDGKKTDKKSFISGRPEGGDFGLEDLDWDSAIAEWEQSALVPEVARDKDTKRAATLGNAPSGAPSPVAPPSASKLPAAPSTPASARTLYQPPKVAPPPPTLPAIVEMREGEEHDEVGNETVVAAVPSELRRSSGPHSPHASSTPPAARGGLGHLFRSRGPEQKDGEVHDVLFEETKAQADDPVLEALELPATEDELSETISHSGDSHLNPPSGLTQVAAPEEYLLHDLPGPDEYSDTTAVPTGETAHGHGLIRTTGVSGVVLHSPAQRAHDPNEDTGTLSREHVRLAMARTAAAAAASRPVPPRPPDDDAPTVLRPSPSGRAPESIPTHLPSAKEFESERAAAEWLGDDARIAHMTRAAWLEQESRANVDPTVCARGLLAVSELHALAGDLEGAERFAIEARDLAPHLPLAHWQARGLMPAPADTPQLVAALDAEIHEAVTTAARLHSTLLAADQLRMGGADEDASLRWDEACRASPADVRAPIARAARALALGDHAHMGLRFSDSPGLSLLSLAVGTVLRMRGVERDDADGGEILPNDSLRRARLALERGDVPAATLLIAELRGVPELSRGAAQLASALGATRRETRANAAQWVQRLIGAEDPQARRTLAARAIELDDASLVDTAMTGDETFSAAERGILCTLMKLPTVLTDSALDGIASVVAMAPLAAALGAISQPATAADFVARAGRTAGTDASRALLRLGRLLAADSAAADIEGAVALVAKDMPDGMRALSMEMALRGGRHDEVSSGLAIWSDADDANDAAARDRQLAAAMIAERAGDKERALAAYRAAQYADRTSEVSLRAIAQFDPHVDLAHELGTVADQLGEGVRGSLARLESVTRSGGLEEAARAELLQRAHQAAPELPFALFLAERGARAEGNVDAVINAIRERRATSTDAQELALDALREALLVADREPELASERLAEAHHARPDDVALRELYERLSTEPQTDRGSWRELRAASTIGSARALLYTEAAYEYERNGDKESALRAALAARASGDDGLARLALERAELEAGSASRLADELLTLARSTENVRERRESYERLADLDAVGPDPASALLWHRTILEDEPSYKPSLRFVEHVLLGEGRDDELEPIASGIARALRGARGGECGAHAEIAARWRLRGEEGWESTRDLAELASQQPEPSLWSLRLANAHARHRKDDAAIMTTTAAIVTRTTRAEELAALHLRAGEAASRLEDLDGARVMLERAAKEDPGDVVTWGLLAEARQHTHDARGAAEAGESLARTSGVPEHQLLAWYDSARLWLELGDADHGVTCLEHAAAIDVTFQDVFERLSALYTQRGSREGLASLLERRIEKITDPEERVAMEVERGRALTDIGDTDGARTALEAALAARPDHTGALSAFGDLCAASGDWAAAETAWVRLARSLTTPEEQRTVYARLGDLYAVHAVNLSRAEVAFKEVLKRSPDDIGTLDRLVDVYSRQNDPARALEVQHKLLVLALEPN